MDATALSRLSPPTERGVLDFIACGSLLPQELETRIAWIIHNHQDSDPQRDPNAPSTRWQYQVPFHTLFSLRDSSARPFRLGQIFSRNTRIEGRYTLVLLGGFLCTGTPPNNAQGVVLPEDLTCSPSFSEEAEALIARSTIGAKLYCADVGRMGRGGGLNERSLVCISLAARIAGGPVVALPLLIRTDPRSFRLGEIVWNQTYRIYSMHRGWQTMNGLADFSADGGDGDRHNEIFRSLAGLMA
jgi:hypothetical protein